MKIHRRTLLLILIWLISILVAFQAGKTQQSYQDWIQFARKVGPECFRKVTE